MPVWLLCPRPRDRGLVVRSSTRVGRCGAPCMDASPASARYERPRVIPTPRIVPLTARPSPPISRDEIWFATVREFAPIPKSLAPLPPPPPQLEEQGGGESEDSAEFLTTFDESSAVLTLDEYCELMGGEELSLEQLRAQFAEFDLDGNGVVDRAELVRAALIDVLVHARTRVLDLLREWDSNGDKRVGRREFRKAVASLELGFCAPGDADAVFELFDEDRSGYLDFRELASHLKPGSIARNRHALRQSAGGRRGNRTGTTLISLRATPRESVLTQLRRLIGSHHARVLDLFREWDVDGLGTVDTLEFRNALTALGYDAPRADVRALFAEFDADGSGELSFEEVNRLLRPLAVAAAAEAARGLHTPRSLKPPPALWLPLEGGRPPNGLCYARRRREPGIPLRTLRTLPPLNPRHIARGRAAGTSP